jgi:hypothetical protein
MRLCDENTLKCRISCLHQTLHKFITEFMQSGMDQGFIRLTDPAYLGMAFSGMVSHFAFHWLFSNDSQPLTSFTETVFNIFLKGAENQDNLKVSGGVFHVS